MTEAQIKRSTIMVDRKMQLHFLLVWVLASLAIIAILAAFAAYFLMNQPPEVDRMVIDNTIRFLVLNAGVFVLFSVVMGVYGILHMHRVAGAIYAMRRVIARAAAGDGEALVQLREGDYLKDLAADLNGLLQQRRKELADLNRATELASTLRGVLSLEANASEDAKKLAAQVSRALEGVE